jgi:peptidoglycan/xylan/chitin deacetylase (PgdA/CDA1 family)
VWENWLRLVEMFERYDVSTTWAIVGRLFTEGSVMDAPPAEDWLRESAVESTERGLTTDVVELPRLNQTLSGRPLVEAVLESDTDHDVGSHSYSHPRVTELTKEAARADFEAAVTAMADWGVDPVSFVYPANAVAHRDVLKQAGFACYRGEARPGSDSGGGFSDESAIRPLLDCVPETWKHRAVQVKDRGSEAIRYTFGDEPPALVEPAYDENGLVAIPQSMPSLYRMPRRLRCAIRATDRYPLARVARMGIDRAIEEDGIFHLWFHPHDFYSDADFESLSRVLEHLANRRDDGLVRVETMADVAARL